MPTTELDQEVDFDLATDKGSWLKGLRNGMAKTIAATLGLTFVGMPAALAIDSGILKVLDRGDPGQVHEVASITGIMLVLGLATLGVTHIRRRNLQESQQTG